MQALLKVLNMAEYALIDPSLWHGSEYTWSMFHKVLDKPPVLNMPGFRMWQGCEYVRVRQGAEYAWISHNTP